MRCISKPWTKQRNGWTTGYPLSKLLIMKRLTHHQEERHSFRKNNTRILSAWSIYLSFGLTLMAYGINNTIHWAFWTRFFIRPSPRRIWWLMASSEPWGNVFGEPEVPTYPIGIRSLTETWEWLVMEPDLHMMRFLEVAWRSQIIDAEMTVDA